MQIAVIQNFNHKKITFTQILLLTLTLAQVNSQTHTKGGRKYREKMRGKRVRVHYKTMKKMAKQKLETDKERV